LDSEVTVYRVFRSGGHYVGLWYFDPYARDGKNSGAWMHSYRLQQRLIGDVAPIVSNTANFRHGRPDEPVLISWDDATTMFHEFGHALHGLLSNVTYAMVTSPKLPIAAGALAQPLHPGHASCLAPARQSPAQCNGKLAHAPRKYLDVWWRLDLWPR
jgi:peptidase M3-like protein